MEFVSDADEAQELVVTRTPRGVDVSIPIGGTSRDGAEILVNNTYETTTDLKPGVTIVPWESFKDREGKPLPRNARVTSVTVSHYPTRAAFHFSWPGPDAQSEE